jgi:hypothetical protein
MVTVTDLAAAAAVAGVLEARGRESITVVHDNFRLFPKGRVHKLSADLATRAVVTRSTRRGDTSHGRRWR